MLINFKQFLINEQYKNIRGKRGILISNELYTLLMKIKNKLSFLYIDLFNAVVEPHNLQEDLPSYLSYDNEGNLTFLKPRYFNEEPDPWNSKRRTSMKMSRAIKLFYKDEFLDKNLTPLDIDAFNKELKNNFSKEGVEIVELRGDDILRAYNYTKELDLKKFGFTCANFGQKEPGGSGYAEPDKSWFDIYTKNPKNIGAVVLIREGRIVARKTFQEGEQFVDNGKNKAGTHQIVYGNYYGELGGGSINDILITNHLKSKGAVSYGLNYDFIIQLEETKFPNYCPFDSMYVNFKYNLLSTSDNLKKLNGENLYWNNTYKANYDPAYNK